MDNKALENSGTAKARIASFADRNSFVEINSLFGNDGESVSCGYATADGRPMFIYACDNNSSLGAMQAEKIASVIEKAAKTGTPILGFLSNSGAKINEGLASAVGYGRIIKAASDASGVVPHILVLDGPAVGAAALYAESADIIIICEGSQIGAVSKGGMQSDAKSAVSAGIAALYAADFTEGAQLARRILSYLPDNSLTECDDLQTDDDINRLCSGLNSDSSADDIINTVFDSESFTQLYNGFAPEAVTGFASIGGRSVGVVCTTGSLTAKVAKKSAHMIAICQAYSIPIITLADTDGISGSCQCTTNAVSALAMAYSTADVPLVTVITGSAIGSGLIVMGSKALGADIVYAWESAKIGLLKGDTAVAMLCGDRIVSSENPIAARTELKTEYEEESMTAQSAAKQGVVDQVISPDETRVYIAAALEAFGAKRELRPIRKTAVLPL